MKIAVMGFGKRLRTGRRVVPLDSSQTNMKKKVNIQREEPQLTVEKL